MISGKGTRVRRGCVCFGDVSTEHHDHGSQAQKKDLSSCNFSEVFHGFLGEN